MRTEASAEMLRRVPQPVVAGVAPGALGGDGVGDLVPEGVQRWTARRRVALVFGILKGEQSIDESARRHGLAVSEIEGWRERLLAAAHNALRSKPRDEEALKEEQIRRLTQKVGELVLEVDMLREALRNARSAGVDEGEE